MMHALGGDDLAHKIPVERCFDWEVLALVELARGSSGTADGYVRRAEAHAAALGLRLPAASHGGPARRGPARRGGGGAGGAARERGGRPRP